MTEKKPYSPPKIFQVELNQQQAILATCSSTASSVSTRGTRGCVPGGCSRQATNTGRNSGAAAS